MNLKYLLLSLLMILLVLPTVAQGGAMLFMILIESLNLRGLSGFGLIAAPVGIAFVGYVWGKHIQLPDRFWPRYAPMLIAIFYILAFWILAMFVSGGDFTHEAFIWMGIGTIPFFVSSFLAVFSGEFWMMLWVPAATYALFTLVFAFGAKRAGKPLVDKKGLKASLGLFCALLLVVGCQGYNRESNLIKEDSEKTVDETISLYDYRPFSEGNLLTPVEKPTLHIGKDWPRLDGATAAYPVYASAVQAIYQGLDASSASKYVTSSRTPEAYKSLIDGQVDLIFAAEPSAEQKKAAADKGVTLTQTPFSREAFVFVASQDNPVTGLTIEQIRSIYSGKINNWRDVGGRDENIIPFQRPVNSGSQTVMLSKVMQGLAMRKPLETERASGMGGLVRRVANYQNVSNALGYSFRYYASQMDKNEKLRLLSVNGVAPTVENIRNGSYPFTVDVYMVTTGKPSANTQALIDWFLSPQGQKLVEDVGYVAMGDVK
ncbi:PstS family phosphate ABC transporter substrate-binding protein [Leminorella grimontii]|uniref:PstS family phosphate ABC transporter substrate-binding protein n=1 Tax=Leminorella grimontii TaxID=82981 RepID=UPI00207DB1AC|nr:PstS family phosphate ABC transporter substrate-binding protein [Leminorella grimontii]GKX60043.1 phosphate ABC transporter substrate-binding protein [Leminorella grimontii]